MGRTSRPKPGERITALKWAGALDAIQARAELLEAKFEGDSRERRLARKA
jgi:hypothetical protein